MIGIRTIKKLFGWEKCPTATTGPQPKPAGCPPAAEILANLDTLAAHGIEFRGLDHVVGRAELIKNLHLMEGIVGGKFTRLQAEVGDLNKLNREFPNWNAQLFTVSGINRAVSVVTGNLENLSSEERDYIKAFDRLSAHGVRFKATFYAITYEPPDYSTCRLDRESRKKMQLVTVNLPVGPSDRSGIAMLLNWPAGGDNPPRLKLAAGNETYQVNTRGELIDLADRVDRLAGASSCVPLDGLTASQREFLTVPALSLPVKSSG